MNISETFYSIQGEGGLVGVPSVFIRTSGCNLRCHWCDTPYTSWEPEKKEQSLDELMAYVRRFSRGHVVVTGGEPMIAPDIVPLTQRLRAEKQHITIETAGTVFAPVECDLMSISPKLSNSTPVARDGGRWAESHERLRYQPDVIRQLMGLCDYQLKFVVVMESDLLEIRAIVQELAADVAKVQLMPEGRTAGEVHERSRWLVEIAKDEGYRYTPRLHVDLFGPQRGV